uniref:Ig-like domain-containing protein n=1 Tax=Hucho hucho TaxID=62062 RepID=A0A4W5Q2F7_9TELE
MPCRCLYTCIYTHTLNQINTYKNTHTHTYNSARHAHKHIQLALFEVLGPTDPIVAVAGDDIILPCYLKPNISAEDMTVDWLNLDFIDSRVYRYQNHRIIRDDQIPSYRGRTSLFEEELWRGNTSLKLTRVQGTDEGRYKCFIKAKTWYDDFPIQVLVKGEVYFHVNVII